MQSLAQFRAMLPVHKHRLDDELEVHADTMDRISQQVWAMNRREVEAKDALAKIEARRGADLRNAAEKGTTVGEIAGLVLRDPERIRAFNAHLNAMEEHAHWKSLLDAWRTKGFNIKTLADLHSANYYSPTSTIASSDQVTTSQQAARQAIRAASQTSSFEGRRERAAFVAETSAAEAGLTPRARVPTKTVADMRTRRRIIE